MNKLTPKRQALVDAAKTAQVSGWTRIPGPGFTIRWDQVLDTPDYAASLWEM